LFKQTSFEAVTVQDIATAAEFGKGTIYQFFDSKEEILIYIICQAMDALCDDIETQCLQEVDVTVGVSRFIALNYRFYLENSNLFLSLLRRRLKGSIKPEWTAEMRPRRHKKMELVARLLERGIAEKIIIPSDSHELARFLENMVKGFSLEVMENRSNDFDPQKDLELISRILSDGIVYRKGEK